MCTQRQHPQTAYSCQTFRVEFFSFLIKVNQKLQKLKELWRNGRQTEGGLMNSNNLQLKYVSNVLQNNQIKTFETLLKPV